MASGKKPRTWADPYLDATLEWAGDLGKEHGLVLQVSLTPARRLGVWRVVVRALAHVDGRPASVVAQRSSEWPDATYQTLGAHVFGMVTALSTELARDELDRERPA